jgi:hypothetical protein
MDICQELLNLIEQIPDEQLSMLLKPIALKDKYLNKGLDINLGGHFARSRSKKQAPNGRISTSLLYQKYCI